MTDREIIDDLINQLQETIEECLLKQAKEIIGKEESIIINYQFDSDFKLFYITTAKPMTNIIWKRIFDVEYGKLKLRDSRLAY